MTMTEAHQPRVWNLHFETPPPDAVYVGRGRGSKWGNPWGHKPSKIPGTVQVATREEAIERYENWLLHTRADLVAAARRELRGRDLSCWCAPRACHADVLLRVANSEPVYTISRDISGQPPLRVVHEGVPPCLYCGEPVIRMSTDGPLVCGPCDCNGGAVWGGDATGVKLIAGTPRITDAHRAHRRHCLEHIIATQPDGRYPPDAGLAWVANWRGGR